MQNTSSSLPPTASRLTFWLGGLISLVTLFLLYRLIDIEALGETLQTARLEYLVLGLLIVYPLAMVSRAQRWWWLLQRDISWRNSLHIINLGYLANMIFPARLGEVVRLILVRNEPAGNSGKAVSAIAVERLLDLLFALMTIALGLALLGSVSDLPSEVVTSLVILLSLTVVGFAILLFTPPLHPLIIRIIEAVLTKLMPPLAERLTRFVERMLTSMQYLANPVRLAIVIGWTTLTWAVYVLFFHLVLLAFLPVPSIGASLLATGFIALSIGVPSVPSYAGPFHVGAALALSTYGYAEVVGASFALTAHALTTMLTILVGMWSMNAMQTNLGTLRHLAQWRQNPDKD